MPKVELRKQLIEQIEHHLRESTIPEDSAQKDAPSITVAELVANLIDINLIEEARRMGMLCKQRDKELDTLTEETRAALNAVMAYVLEGRGRFSVDTPDSITRGGYVAGETIDHAIAAWNDLPALIAADLAESRAGVAAFEEQLDTLRVVHNGAKALTALVDTIGDDRQQTIERAMTDPAMIDALGAAADSDVEDAAVNVIRGQADVSDRIDVFMQHVSDVYADTFYNKIDFNIEITGRRVWVMAPLATASPIRIDATALDRLLVNATTPSAAGTELMNMYFRGDITFPANELADDPIARSQMFAKLFAAAFERMQKATACTPT